MRGLQRLLILGMFLGILSLCADGQDLGTSNKLFGKTKPGPAKSKQPARRPKSSATIAKSKPKSGRKPSAEAKTSVRIARQAPEKPTTSVKITPVRLAPQTPEKRTTSDTKTPIRIGPRIPIPPRTSVKDQPIKVSPVEDRSRDETFDRLLTEGNSAQSSHRYSAAESSLRRARDLKPSDPRADMLLGAIYVDTHRWEEAEKAYRKVIRLEPQNADAYRSLSLILTQPVASPELSDRYAAAEQMARKAIQIRSENAAASDQLGVALERQGLIGSETENAYRRAITIDPSYAPGYAHLGRLMLRRGRTSEAASLNSQAVTKAGDVRTMVLVADTFQSEQRFGDSIALLERALDRDPRDPSVLFLIGKALTAAGKYEEAETFLIRSTEVSPLSSLGFGLLGTSYILQGKYEIGESWLLQAAKVADIFERRQLAGQFESLGDAYSGERKNSAAERAFRTALTLDATRTALAAKIAGIRR